MPHTAKESKGKTKGDTGSVKQESSKGKGKKKVKGKGKSAKEEGETKVEEATDKEATDEEATEKKKDDGVKTEGKGKAKKANAKVVITTEQAKETKKLKDGKIKKRKSVIMSSDDNADPEIQPKQKKSREPLDSGKPFIYFIIDLCVLLLILFSVTIPVRRSQRSLATSRASSTLSLTSSGLSMPSIRNEGSSSGDWDPKVPKPGHFPLKSKSSSNLSLHTSSRASSSVPGGSNPPASEASVPSDNTAW